MNASTQLADHVVDLLSDWGAVSARRMFGGIGLFCEARMFGLIFDGQLYFRADADAARSESERAFVYYRTGRRVRLPYLRVDAEALEQPGTFARLALAAWLAAGTKQRTRKGASA